MAYGDALSDEVAGGGVNKDEYAVIAENLVKRYGSVEALRGVSFRVRYGEIFGFLGPNGAGKTTTIHILSTLIKPTSGKAFVAGHDVVREADAVRKSIGIVFQDPSLDNELTAYENLYIHGRIYGLRGEELRYRIEEMLRFAELYEHRNRLVKHFSGGMRRRLEIARAFLHKPKVLFLDEPTLGLDPQTRSHIWEYVRRLRGEGVTIFMTTHYMDEAEELCDRIAIIDHGKIIAEGTPEELKGIVGSDVIYLKIDGGVGGDACSKISNALVTECRPVRSDLIVLKVRDAGKSLPEIIREASVKGVKVSEVSYRKPSLNDVFLYLTGREIREEGEGELSMVRAVIMSRLRRR